VTGGHSTGLLADIGLHPTAADEIMSRRA